MARVLVKAIHGLLLQQQQQHRHRHQQQQLSLSVCYCLSNRLWEERKNSAPGLL